jgi:hypothetical protein
VFVAVIAILPYILLWAGDVQSFPVRRHDRADRVGWRSS